MAPDDLAAALRAAGCVFAEDEARLLLDSATDETELATLLAARVAGQPLEQVLGHTEFCGLRIAMAPGVFVPRQRSSALVRRAARSLRAGDLVLDLCCGSGAVGAALAASCPGLEVYAADIDPAAVACARRNLPPDRVFEGDLFEALPDDLGGQFRVVVANAPYVPTDAIATMPPEARDHEHLVALDGGADGLDLHRRIVDQVRDWLAPGGTLLIESSRAQAPYTAALMAAVGLDVEVSVDEEVDGTVVAGSSVPS